MITVQETSKYIEVNNIRTHYHEAGTGEKTVILIHGSGPGVSAWANWRLVLPLLSDDFKLYAPDVVGFGDTENPQSNDYSVDQWVTHMINFIESIDKKPVSIIGNSMGGALALHIAHRRPDLIEKLVLMGSVGVKHSISEGLEKVWGYTPSIESMRELIELFSFDQTAATNDELVKLRYESSIQPGVQEAFSAMFPSPRQNKLDELALTDDELTNIKTPTLLIHGLNDRVIPIESTSYRLVQLLPNAELHVFSQCGHWTQIEKTEPFVEEVRLFLNR